jgi:hypothetical protein
MAARKGIPAAAFMASFSSAGRISICVACQTKAAPDNSLYCSDACRREFLTVVECAKRILTPKESN